ncbi:hypothetical protein ACFX14_008192 [Malus domestica]
MLLDTWHHMVEEEYAFISTSRIKGCCVEGKRLLCDGTNCFSFKFNLLCLVILQFSSKNLYFDLLVLHLA